jgi:hypothetical protein
VGCAVGCGLGTTVGKLVGRIEGTWVGFGVTTSHCSWISNCVFVVEPWGEAKERYTNTYMRLTPASSSCAKAPAMISKLWPLLLGEVHCSALPLVSARAV